MSKKEGKGLKSFNKGFQVPDTYIIILFSNLFETYRMAKQIAKEEEEAAVEEAIRKIKARQKEKENNSQP